MAGALNQYGARVRGRETLKSGSTLEEITATVATPERPHLLPSALRRKANTETQVEENLEKCFSESPNARGKGLLEAMNFPRNPGCCFLFLIKAPRDKKEREL
jgi:hypothetical protein